MTKSQTQSLWFSWSGIWPKHQIFFFFFQKSSSVMLSYSQYWEALIVISPRQLQESSEDHSWAMGMHELDLPSITLVPRTLLDATRGSHLSSEPQSCHPYKGLYPSPCSILCWATQSERTPVVGHNAGGQGLVLIRAALGEPSNPRPSPTSLFIDSPK